MALGWSRAFKGWGRWLALVIGVSLAILLLMVAKPAQGAAAPAKSADAFVDSIGVNTHINYLDTVYNSKYTTIRDELAASGIRHARDKALTSNDPAFDALVYGRYRELTSLGIKYALHVDPRHENQTTIDRTKIAQIAEKAGPSLEALEGPNEWDISGDPNWAANLRAYQKDLYDAVKGNSSTANVPVLGPPLAHAANAASLGNLEAYFDYGNMHPYPGGRYPSESTLDNYNIFNTRKISPTKPLMPTETGYHNALNSTDPHAGVPEAVAGKYMPRLFLEYFNRGIPRTYGYEFVDVLPDPNHQDLQDNFGILRNDGSEKPAYGTLKNLIGLLKDPGPAFEPGSLGYSLSGATGDLNHTLLQKRDGRFYLVLWVGKPSWDPINGGEIEVPSQRVTLTLDTPFDATIYLPNDFSSAASQSSRPVTSLMLDVPDHPLVVELTPDTIAPTVSAPSGTPAFPVSLGDPEVPVKLPWSGSGNSGGIAGHELRKERGRRPKPS